jgi:hypothetical protein
MWWGIDYVLLYARRSPCCCLCPEALSIWRELLGFPFVPLRDLRNRAQPQFVKRPSIKLERCAELKDFSSMRLNAGGDISWWIALCVAFVCRWFRQRCRQAFSRDSATAWMLEFAINFSWAVLCRYEVSKRGALGPTKMEMHWVPM